MTDQYDRQYKLIAIGLPQNYKNNKLSDDILNELYEKFNQNGVLTERLTDGLIKGLPANLDITTVPAMPARPAKRPVTDKSKKNRIIRFTVDYPGRSRYMQVIAGRELTITIHTRDQNDRYIRPKGKIEVFAFPYEGRHRKNNDNNFPINRVNQINVKVLEDQNQVGRYHTDWKPDLGKYELFIMYNNKTVGHKNFFILKVKYNRPNRPNRPIYF